MQFHEYITFRTLIARHGDEAQKDFARKVSSHELRKVAMEWHANSTIKNDLNSFNELSRIICEQCWVALNRPFYNVWPVVISLAPSVKLNLKFSQVEIPFIAILLRFARGHEPHHLRTAILFWPKEFNNEFRTIQIICHFADEADNLLTVQHAYKPEDNIEEWITNLEQKRSGLTDYQHAAGLLVVRLVVLVGLLSHGNDFITPVILAKDRIKYESTDESEVKRWIEERAVRRAGLGFDVGKKLELARDQSPHWRNPHFCLFWTGEGRTIPVIKMRSGAIIQNVSIAEVPTGYLGPEGEEEDHLDPEKTPRESISKRRRFTILKRDGFRCQLCGMSSEDGTKLHVDHLIPIAKGGSNDDENLWTLCERCNLGKSDTMM